MDFELAEERYFNEGEKDQILSQPRSEAEGQDAAQANKDGSKEEPAKVRKVVRSYKAENLIEDVNGLDALFKTMTQQPETMA